MFLQKFTFVVKHKSGMSNKVADALSRRTSLLLALQTEITGLKELKDMYATDSDFAEIWSRSLLHFPNEDYYIQDGFIFKGNQLCVPNTFLRSQIIQEMHSNGLAAHTSQDKTVALVQSKIFWPK